MVSCCPINGQPGKSVQGQTIKAMLAVTLRRVDQADYLFCPAADCSTVYFSSDGLQTFTTADVREPVYQKCPDADEVLVCYCFRHSIGEIRAASTERRAEILDDIHAGIRAGQCACDLRNPEGTCCLGNVRTVIQRLAA
jgi:hypothetical protein